MLQSTFWYITDIYFFLSDEVTERPGSEVTTENPAPNFVSPGGMDLTILFNIMKKIGACFYINLFKFVFKKYIICRVVNTLRWNSGNTDSCFEELKHKRPPVAKQKQTDRSSRISLRVIYFLFVFFFSVQQQ